MRRSFHVAQLGFCHRSGYFRDLLTRLFGQMQLRFIGCSFGETLRISQTQDFAHLLNFLFLATFDFPTVHFEKPMNLEYDQWEDRCAVFQYCWGKARPAIFPGVAIHLRILAHLAQATAICID